MDDLISRQAAIEAAYKSLGKPLMSKKWGKMLVALKDIPSAQRWISVNDELPEPRHAVLVWCPERKNSYCAYTVDGRWIIFGSNGYVLEESVEAWMYAPIPE